MPPLAENGLDAHLADHVGIRLHADRGGRSNHVQTPGAVGVLQADGTGMEHSRAIKVLGQGLALRQQAADAEVSHVTAVKMLPLR